MTQQEKLEKLIEKAIGNGWHAYGFANEQWQYTIGSSTDVIGVAAFRNNSVRSDFLSLHAYDIIFSHDFARSLFGERMIFLEDEGLAWHMSDDPEYKDWLGALELPLWQYHLQQAVVSDDPISYTYQAVFGGEEAAA